MNHFNDAIRVLIEEFSKFPGIGRKSAEKFAYHIVTLPKDEALKLAHGIRDVKNNLKNCSRCFTITDKDPCDICSNPRRDAASICVVEQPKDVIAIEKTNSYNGLYHVLMGHISPLEDMGPEKLTIRQLIARIKKTGIKEVILATNPNMEGDATAHYIAELLKGMNVTVSRIARGLPSGGSLEYANKLMLQDAMRQRHNVEAE